MICTNCGAVLDDGVKFCTQCGTKLSDAPVPTAKPKQKLKYELIGNTVPAVEVSLNAGDSVCTQCRFGKGTRQMGDFCGFG